MRILSLDATTRVNPHLHDEAVGIKLKNGIKVMSRRLAILQITLIL